MATATSPRTLGTAPAPEVEPRPDLRIVEEVDEAPERRSFGGLVGTFSVILLFVCVFGLVVFQVLLVQTQSHLDDLDNTLSTQEARAKELDLETADLESPDRIVAAALGLGMIAPDEPVFLEPAEGDDERAALDPATEPIGTVQATEAGVESPGTTGTATTTGTTIPTSGAALPPGPPYTAENNWGAGGPPTTPPVYSAENNWGASPTTTPTSGR